MNGNQSSNNYICSVVITVHSEGILLHRTMRALEYSIQYAKKINGYNSEVIIVKDNVTDPITHGVVGFWVNRLMEEVSVYNVNFGALSLSRNYGISKASGSYISILDGDDLYSENWINEAINTLERGEGDVAHPSIIIGFPLDPFLKELIFKSNYLLKIFEENLWPALIMAPKSIFDEIPYIKDEGQFAYEDWLWNCDTIEKGFRHVCVDGTLMAIRQKPPGLSLWQSSFSQNKVVRPNKLFQKLIKDLYVAHSSIEKQNCHKKSLMNRALENINFKNPDFYKFLKKTKRKIFKSDINSIKNCIRNELEKLEKIEPELALIQNFRSVHEVGKIPLLLMIPEKLSNLLKSEELDIFFVGSEKDFAFYPHHLISNRKFAIITDKVNQKTFTLDIEYILLQEIKVNMERLTYLILRLLMEAKIDRIIVVNSDFATNLLTKYGDVINSKEKCIYIKTPENFLINQKIEDLNIIKVLSSFNFFDKIYIDCPDFASKIIETYGIPEEKITINANIKYRNTL